MVLKYLVVGCTCSAEDYAAFALLVQVADFSSAQLEGFVEFDVVLEGWIVPFVVLLALGDPFLLVKWRAASVAFDLHLVLQLSFDPACGTSANDLFPQEGAVFVPAPRLHCYLVLD
jgi:hypothetical protein